MLDIIEIDDTKDLQKVFTCFLLLYVKISQFHYQKIQQKLFDLSSKYFASPHVLDILKSPKFDRSLIQGLSKFCWNCPTSVFNGGEDLYETLYSIFCEIDGRERQNIVAIALAIERASGISFTSLPSMKQIHCRMIQKITQQFYVE